MDERIGAEIFDVDHTITRNITAVSYLYLLVKKKIFSVTILRHLPYICMNYKFGRMSDKHFDRRIEELEGVDRKFLEEAAEETFRNMLKKDHIYADSKRYIEHLKSNNKKIILATSSLDVIIKPLADYLGVDTVIATRFAYDENNRCRGYFDGKPAFREEKRRRVMEYVRENHIDLAASSFYSDSIHDAPLFNEVGNPVAVNPDIRLTFYAKKNGWPILRFR